jgi:carbon starvation protein CstA
MLVLPVDPSFMPLATWQPTVIFTTLFLVLATIVFLIINAFAANPSRVFTIVATIALVVSIIPDFMLLINPTGMPVGTVTLGAVIILILMHVVGYVIALWAFTKWAPQG